MRRRAKGRRRAGQRSGDGAEGRGKKVHAIGAHFWGTHDSRQARVDKRELSVLRRDLNAIKVLVKLEQRQCWTQAPAVPPRPTHKFNNRFSLSGCIQAEAESQKN